MRIAAVPNREPLRQDPADLLERGAPRPAVGWAGCEGETSVEETEVLPEGGA